MANPEIESNGNKITMIDYYSCFSMRREDSKKFQIFKNEIEYAINGMFNFLNILMKELTKKGQVDLPDGYPVMLYEKNCHYIVGIYELITNGLLNPAHSLSRTVIEDIWIIYMTSFDDKEYIENYHRLKDNEYRRLQKLTIQDNIEDIDKNEYKYKVISSRLYTPSRQKEMYEVYSKLSDSVHSSVTGFLIDGQFDPIKIEEEYKSLLNLIFTNLCAIWEIYQNKELSQHRKMLFHFIDRIGRILGKVTFFSPNSDNYMSKFLSIERQNPPPS